MARKKAEDLYRGTGHDPDPKARRRLQRRMKRRLKKAKGSSSTSSQSSSTSTEDRGEDEILEDRSKIQKLADQGPGLLAAAAVRTMKTFVVQASGATWNLDEDSLPPIMSQYARSYLAPKGIGGLFREAFTLAHIGPSPDASPCRGFGRSGQRLKS